MIKLTYSYRLRFLCACTRWHVLRYLAERHAIRNGSPGPSAPPPGSAARRCLRQWSTKSGRLLPGRGDWRLGIRAPHALLALPWAYKSPCHAALQPPSLSLAAIRGGGGGQFYVFKAVAHISVAFFAVAWCVRPHLEPREP
jgi:hypothetical protein